MRPGLSSDAASAALEEHGLNTVAVGGMIFLSVCLSYFQESRSTKAVEKLQKIP
jgi:hypothetical protein